MPPVRSSLTHAAVAPDAGPAPTRTGSTAAAPSDLTASSEELRRLCRAEAWPAEARFERIVAAAAVGANALAWFANFSLLGVSRLSLAVLALNVVAALSALPWLAGTFARTEPRWHDAAKLAYIAVSMGGTIAICQLNPTHISSQGWGIVMAWALVGLLLRVPVRSKLLLNAPLFAAYVVHLLHVTRQRGPAYASTHEIVVVLMCAALAAFLLPWVPHRLQEHRYRELAIRRRLEERERDLIEQTRRAERAAGEATQSARDAANQSRLRTELFANMSHDLRTPMAGILGIVELMRDTPLTDEQASFIETIRASNQTLLSLLDDAIDFARIEEGKLPICAVPVALGETLRRPAELMRVTAARKGLALHIDIAPDLPRYIRLDPARVQQVLLNLLGNAVKFTQRGAVTLRARAHTDASGRALLRVEVDDTGIGFTAEQASLLFQRFSQAPDVAAGKFGGSGLGLSICKGLLDLMGGSIGAQSRLEGGARFWFELPMERTEAPSGSAAKSAVPELSVLLAEDNPVNQLVLSAMLQKLGQRVTVAGDGGEALRLLTERTFDLAIMDMRMPVMDGADVVRRLRARDAEPRLQIVALTASATADQQAEFRAAGVDAVYTKPIDMDRLRRLLVHEGAALSARREGHLARLPPASVPAV
ncbi:MAG: ATP-binding protein [Polyangiaceae bacterium]